MRAVVKYGANVDDVIAILINRHIARRSKIIEL